MKKVLLYSGGLDSWLISQIWKPDMRLYVNMHTEYSQQEIDRLPQDVKVGTTIMLDDGLIRMTALEVTDTDIVCRVENGGPIKDKKGRHD